MKIEYTSGCICDSLTIDDKETADMKLPKLKEHLIKVIDNVNDLGTLQSVLISLTEDMGDYKCVGHCSTCGDSIEKYTLSID